jgi:glycosyltransferase involved in cell wall biosynthesis
MIDLSILVPVYNEKATIEEALARLEKLEGFSYELIVVEDFSTDGTREWLEAWSKRSKGQPTIKLIAHDHNQGKGAAIRTGLRVATGRYFVVQDADLEYDPSELGALMNATKNSRVVYGSRFLGSIEGMHPANYWANRFYNFLLRLLYGVKLTDMHTCYKLLETELLRDLDLQSEGFDYATEVISKLLLRHEKIVEVPISFHGRTVAEGKKIGWNDGWECVLKLFQYRFGARGELIRFAIVGGIGFAVNFLLLLLLHGVLKQSLVISQLVAAETAILCTFTLHHNWTYKEFATRPLAARLLRFQLSASAGVLINTAVLWLLTSELRVQYLVSLTLGAMVAFFWNYYFNRQQIWKHDSVLASNLLK